ncbi:MAG: DUF2147 domain-containing protein [Alphaproteobacteria bacterium HGW-Alphaproteobacteria-2]|nr:MAG: DUF2147 domain-containing protein [Alphaproteobacteria bacterium HGW-Alphaproteobacteria-2]
MRLGILSGVLIMALAAPAFAADPVEGVWQTRPDDNGNFGHVQVAPCGAQICGTLITSFNSEGKQIESPNVGRQIVWAMTPEGNGSYGGGKIWAPDRDKVYNSRMQLSGDVLTVKGCVLGGLACRGSEWVRAR